MAIPRGPSNAPVPAGEHCDRCGAPFHCGIDDAGGCWCAKLPPLPRRAYAAGSGCLCLSCLNESLQGDVG